MGSGREGRPSTASTCAVTVDPGGAYGWSALELRMRTLSTSVALWKPLGAHDEAAHAARPADNHTTRRAPFIAHISRRRPRLGKMGRSLAYDVCVEL